MDRRLKFRQGLSSLYLPLYDALCAELTDKWQPYCGLRTFDEQGVLYRQGRSAPGEIVTRAKGGESPHNYGCASDWCLWEDGNPMWPNTTDSSWREYLDAIEKMGLRPGAEWGDFPHNELKLNCDWKHVLIAWGQGGMIKAQQFIEERRA